MKEMHRDKLDQALNKIGAYEKGKIKLIDYREHDFEDGGELNSLITGSHLWFFSSIA